MNSFESDYYSSDGASETGEDTDLEDQTEEYAPQKETVIVFLDVDSFDVQVRGRDQGISSEDLQQEPFVAVNGHNVITAVNYPAKRLGVERSRGCTLEIAQEMCQSKGQRLQKLLIPDHYGKPDALALRKKSDDIFESMQRSLQMLCQGGHLPKIEKASKDEYFIDVTDQVFHRVHHLQQKVPSHKEVNMLKQARCFVEAPGHRASGDKLSFRTLQVLTNPSIIKERHVTEALLMHGAAIAHTILKDILRDTGLIVSAGISTNKLLAKLGCGLNKPNAITILPQSSLGRVSKKISITDIPSLGGKLGTEVMSKLRIQTMSQLGHKDRVELTKRFRSEQALKFHELAIGHDPTKVVAKKFCNNLTCGITFNYRTRRMSKPQHFKQNMRNRFLEMRDHLIYECGRHGAGRIPKSFRLEIRTRKGGLKVAFGETEELSNKLRTTVGREAEMYENAAPTGKHYLPPEWEIIYEHFVNRLRQECRISVLDEHFNTACTAIRKVSAINLIATFLPMECDED